MASTKAIEEALNHLSSYTGKNPYMLMLKRDVFTKGQQEALTDFVVEYINRNYNVDPLEINRKTKIADWFGEKCKEKWGLDLNVYCTITFGFETYQIVRLHEFKRSIGLVAYRSSANGKNVVDLYLRNHK